MAAGGRGEGQRAALDELCGEPGESSCFQCLGWDRAGGAAIAVRGKVGIDALDQEDILGAAAGEDGFSARRLGKDGIADAACGEFEQGALYVCRRFNAEQVTIEPVVMEMVAAAAFRRWAVEIRVGEEAGEQIGQECAAACPIAVGIKGQVACIQPSMRPLPGPVS